MLSARFVRPASRMQPNRNPARWTLVPRAALLLALLPGCPPRPSPTTAVGLQLVAEGLTSPVALVPPPDGSGRLFIVEQIGQIRVLQPDSGLMPDPFLDVSDRMVPLDPAGDERGLLGLAFHPDYAGNGRFLIL
jgi:glucose/arabinose dehydrogenase